MNTSGKNSAILLVGALVAGLLFAVYYYVVSPKVDEVEAKESSITALNTEISTITEQMALIEEERDLATTNLLGLRKKVPQTRGIENILRYIEEIEAVTGTRVESISFNNYDSLVSGAGLIDPNAPVVEEGAEGAADGTTDGQTPEQAAKAPAEGGTLASEEQVEVPVSTILPEALPAELKLVTLSIDVISPKFAQLQEFIREFEKIDRVMKVDTFDFALPKEQELVLKNPNLEVSSTIQITTFYYEGNQ